RSARLRLPGRGDGLRRRRPCPRRAAARRRRRAPDGPAGAAVRAHPGAARRRVRRSRGIARGGRGDPCLNRASRSPSSARTGSARRRSATASRRV
ncbi:MAG: hypothetical protein F9K16_14550, partial [Thermoanaerobaculia bacterium]